MKDRVYCIYYTHHFDIENTIIISEVQFCLSETRAEFLKSLYEEAYIKTREYVLKVWDNYVKERDKIESKGYNKELLNDTYDKHNKKIAKAIDIFYKHTKIDRNTYPIDFDEKIPGEFIIKEHPLDITGV